MRIQGYLHIQVVGGTTLEEKGTGRMKKENIGKPSHFKE